MLGNILEVPGTVDFLNNDEIGLYTNAIGFRIGQMPGVGRPKCAGLGTGSRK